MAVLTAVKFFSDLATQMELIIQNSQLIYNTYCLSDIVKQILNGINRLNRQIYY